MSATSRVLIAGHSAIAAACACLLRHAGQDLTLLGNYAREITLRGFWGDCRASGFNLASTIADLNGTYDLIMLTDPSDASTLRPFAANDSLALAFSSDRETLDAIAAVFGPEQTLGAHISHRALATAEEVTIIASENPLAIGPLEVSDCVMMENIHRWIRAFQAAGIPCAATADVLSIGQMANQPRLVLNTRQ